jgi:hypothetical protein
MMVSDQELIVAANQTFGQFLAFVQGSGRLVSESESPEAAAIVNMVKSVSGRLVEAAGLRGEYPWQIMVVKAKEVNAFALPNGKIVVFTGLLPITQTEAGLAAVIGHEIGHIMARHSAERLSQALLADLAIQTLDLALSNSKHRATIAAATGLGIQYGILLPFSRTHELEADRIGLFLMAKAGYDPAEAVKVWQRMGAKGSGPWEFLSTHPSAATREAQLAESLPDALVYYADGKRPLPVDLGEAKKIRATQDLQAQLAPVAPRPSFLPGYWWRVQKSNESTPTTRRFDRVENCRVGTCLVILDDKGATSLLTENYESVEDRTNKGVFKATPPMKLVEWPLRVGAKWSQAINVETADGRVMNLTTRVEVVSYESVETRAGSFMAYKVVASANGSKFMEYWYSPEVRNTVRVWERTGLFSSVTTELIDYERTNQPVVETEELKLANVSKNEFSSGVAQSAVSIPTSAPQADTSLIIPSVSAPITPAPKNDQTRPERLTGVASLKSSPATPSEPRPMTKIKASLIQYDGPKIKSGVTLDAQFLDDGSGHGDSTVSDVRSVILRGRFTTINPGVPNWPKPKILDRQTLNTLQISSDKPWVIATFSNTDTVLECVYGETQPLGQKKGACRDNWGNRYHLYITP